uniref:LRRNT domain-containing protein n=1 Tax=Oryzias sinensis TaxID=183150 RepID=A0A8C7YK21_9TELE
MARFLLLYSLLLFGGQRSSACPEPCSCRGGRVDCSGRSLTSTSMPTSFPAGATELLLHDNLITTLPNGLLDGLSSLRSVSLQGNPCNCKYTKIKQVFFTCLTLSFFHTGIHQT